ncbi:hypothetical protein R1flu_009305 [Riccia fluitans]|uniref:Wound-induced protein 1 n=1 Tax=Riccia fluitans TaxID=41844 RepID=A0ABD1Z2I5_9MARC
MEHRKKAFYGKLFIRKRKLPIPDGINRLTPPRLKIAEIFEELANDSSNLEDSTSDEGIVRALYRALSQGDVQPVSKLVAPDLEWWFHGPPSQDHMMRLLTGAASCDSFSFEPVRFFSRGSKVFVEGRHCTRRSVYWVHIWTVKDRRIVQLREYFNTAVLVTDLKPNKPSAELVSNYPCTTIWQSQLWKSKEGKSLPGYILAV